MTRKQKQLGRLALISMLIAMGTGVGMAQASDGHHGHRHYDGCGCQVERNAGFITIDGHKSRVTSGRGMNAQIVRAFRKAGYRAWISDGCVRVDYGYCRPIVRWQTDGYAARLSWGWDELSISLRRSSSRSHYQPVRRMRPMRPVNRYRSCGW